MYASYEGVGSEAVASKGSIETFGRFLKLLELVPQLRFGGVHDNVEQRDSGAGVLGRLAELVSIYRTKFRIRSHT